MRFRMVPQWGTLFAVCVSVVSAGSQPAFAQPESEYPTRPIRMIVPFAAGGTADTLARLTGQELAERWGQQVLIDNRPGAGGNIGAALLAKATADGYTVMMSSISLAIGAGLYKNLPFDVLNDFLPVTLVASIPMTLVVHPSVPARSVKEYVELAKSNPSKVTFSSGGNGTPSHIAGELFAKMTGVKMVHVPYKGGAPAVVDLLAGQVSSMFDNSLSVPAHIKAGKLRALGVSTKTRSSLLPDVPTIIEAGVPGYEFVSWIGLFAPAGTPQSIVSKLQREISAILRMPNVQKQLRNQNAEPIGSTPEEFARSFMADVTSLGKLIREVGAQVD